MCRKALRGEINYPDLGCTFEKQNIYFILLHFGMKKI